LTSLEPVECDHGPIVFQTHTTDKGLMRVGLGSITWIVDCVTGCPVKGSQSLGNPYRVRNAPTPKEIITCQEWFKTRQGLLALNTDILQFDSYKDVLRFRLKAAFLAGVNSKD